MHIVYKLNREDNKSYIGIVKSNRFKTRMHEHSISKRFKGMKFSNEILENYLPYEEACKKEKYYIEFFDTYKNGLNKTRDGSGNHNSPKFTTMGYKFSLESRKKMSISAKKAISEGRKKLWNKGVKNCFSKEALESRRQKVLGRQLYTKLTKEQVIEIRNRFILFNDEKIGKVQKNGIPMSKIQAFAFAVSKDYNISPACIKRIIKRETWLNV